MSLFDYKMSIELAAKDYPFYSVVMAAMCQADTDNLYALRTAFPYVYRELVERYNAPGGWLSGEQKFVDAPGILHEDKGFTNEEQMVLGYMLGSECPFPKPGDFFSALIDNIAHADIYNKRKLAKGFPELVAAVTSYQYGDLYLRWENHAAILAQGGGSE